MKKNRGKVNRNKTSESSAIKFLSIAVLILVPLAVIYLCIANYYHTHFYDNTVINGVDTAKMTISEAEEIINAEVKSYSLNLVERNDGSDIIDGKSINLHTEFELSMSDLLDGQNELAWPVAIFKPHEIQIKTMLEYDDALLKEKFQKLNCFTKAQALEPENASISEYGENGYEIIPEQQGAKVIEDKLYKAITKSISSLEPSLSLEEIDCYEKPEITSKYPKLVEALDKLNKIAGAKITYEFGAATEVLDGDKISKMLRLDDDYKVVLNTDGIKEFVDYIGKTYNSFGRIREFKTSYKKTIKVSGGDYGWWMNRVRETSELTDLVMKGEKVKRDPVYFQTAQQYGKDDIGNTYVEINLTAQHLFFYVEGKFILEADFVSGNESKNLGTPVGTYPVQYKENDATLVGEDYETPVKYWMPFNKNIGLHDAPWRDEFGKDIYLTNGSHGCINMPPAAAKKMFKYMKRGVAVVVYELPGTENYEVKEKVTTKEKEAAKDKKTIEVKPPTQ